MSVSNGYASVFNAVGADFTNQFLEGTRYSVKPAPGYATEANEHDIITNCNGD